MKLLIAAIAIASASPALAQAADPHAGHHPSGAPATPAQPDQTPAKKDCCEDGKAECCKHMKGKGCCADKAKSGSDAHAEHKSH